MTTPNGLEGNALRLWDDTTERYDLETHELLTLEQACREIMLIERIQRDIDALAKLMDEGSMGQRVVSDLVKEVRQHRAKYEGSIRALNLPADDGVPNPRSVQAREAAKARWRRAS